MDKQTLLRLITEFSRESALNRVSAAAALSPELVGFRMYEEPLVGIADAGDPYFEILRRPGVVGPHFRPPAAWLPAARSVVSLFFPFTDQVANP